MTAFDQLRNDGDVVIFRWERLLGDRWSPITLPATGDGYRTPLHDKLTRPFFDTWQKYGVHGFETEKAARAAFPHVEKMAARDPEYPQYRLARVHLVRETSSVMDVTFKPEVKAVEAAKVAKKASR